MKLVATLAHITLAITVAACAGSKFEAGPPETAGRVIFERNTSFDGDVLKIELNREDGGKEKFSTARDEWFSWYWVPFLPNHVGRR